MSSVKPAKIEARSTQVVGRILTAKRSLFNAISQNSLSELTQTSNKAGSAHTEHIELTVKPASLPLSDVVTIDTPLAARDKAEVNADAVMLCVCCVLKICCELSVVNYLLCTQAVYSSRVVAFGGTDIELPRSADPEFGIFVHLHPVRDPADRS